MEAPGVIARPVAHGGGAAAEAARLAGEARVYACACGDSVGLQPKSVGAVARGELASGR